MRPIGDLRFRCAAWTRQQRRAGELPPDAAPRRCHGRFGGVGVTMDISPDQALVELQRANEALRQLLDEQRAERNAALAEVMEVINRSPGDPQPGFQTILEKAHSLCGAAVGAVFTCDGEYFRAVATRGFPEQHDALVRRPFRPNTHHMELMRSGRPAHIPDLKAIAVSPDDEVVRNTVERTDVRTLLAVPLRKDEAVVGWISAFRNEVRLFSESEIALLGNFAAQAVIAMENARLLDELRQRTQDLQESLEYQTATGDVLKVISQSDGELGAVLDTL